MDEEVLSTAYSVGYRKVPMGEASVIVWVKEVTPKKGMREAVAVIPDTTMEIMADDWFWIW